MNRVVRPERLDTLSAEDPLAIASRRDLRRIHRIMGNARLLARGVARLSPLPPAPTVVDLGAGDGYGAAAWIPRLRTTPGCLHLVDRAPAVDPRAVAELARRGWRVVVHVQEVFEFLADPVVANADLVATSLFLHHFGDADLQRLLARVAPVTARLVACEPRRSRLARVAARLLGLIGCNEVTRHDAVVSVEAGFRDGELAALWPGRGTDREPGTSRCQEGAAGWFSHLFSTERVHS